MTVKRNIQPAILSLIIALILLFRLHVVIFRYIDPDEFAHLHWAYLLAAGKIPYQDFFLYHIPLYQLYLMPVFLLPHSSFLLYVARVWEFLLYLLVTALLGKIAYEFTKSTRIVLLSLLVFLTFPMTFDKTIDIRPDMLMIFFFLVSVHAALTSASLTPKRLLLIGIAFGASLMTFPKIIFALPSLIFLLILKKNSTPGVEYGFIGKFINLWPSTFGAVIPFAVFGLLLIATGTLGSGIELITQGAWAVSAGKIPFSPWKSLSPWPVIYLGMGGLSLPWIVNTLVWIIAMAGLLRLYFVNKEVALFLTLFYAGGILFLFLFPAPYIQYFLPLSLFASLLVAVFIDWLNSVLDQQIKIRLKPSLLMILFSILLFGSSFFLQYRERAGSTSEEQARVIDTVATITKPNETFYDMVGSYLIRPDGYYICCHPYAEFVDKLKTKPSSLPDSLITNKTKFIVLDRTGLAFWKPLPEDLFFLFKHYIESPHKKIYVLGAKFNCVSSICSQVDINYRPITYPANEFEIIIDETYVIETTPPNQPVVINEMTLTTNTLSFSPGLYSFSVPPHVTSFQIRMAR